MESTHLRCIYCSKTNFVYLLCTSQYEVSAQSREVELQVHVTFKVNRVDVQGSQVEQDQHP